MISKLTGKSLLVLLILAGLWQPAISRLRAEDSGSKSNASERLFNLMDKKLESVYQHYQKGHYEKTISELEWLEERLRSKALREKYLPLVFYWKGMTHYKMQEYHSAVKRFKKAIELKHQSEDLYYHYGQSLYALDELEAARQAFAASVKLQYKPAVSLYYIGFIYQMQGDKKRAIRFYRMVEKVEDPEGAEVKQAALAQIGDIYLEQVLRQDENRIEYGLNRFVLPSYERAIGINEDADIATQLSDKIYEIQKRFDMTQLTMRNGLPVPRKKSFVKFTQALTYDDNVTFEADDTTTIASDRSSLISVTDFFTRYKAPLRDFAFIMPELRGNYSHHFNRDSPKVYANDNFNFSYGLRTSWEHSYNEKPASFLLDYIKGRSYRNYDEGSSPSFFNETSTFIIGERLRLFGNSNTTFRYINQALTSFDSNQNSRLQMFRVEQIGRLLGISTYVALNFADLKVENAVQNNRSYSLNTRFFFPTIFWKIAPTLGVNYTLTDPYNMREQRGTEKLISPNISLTRLFAKKYLLSLSYSRIDNESRDMTNYGFVKNLTSLSLDVFY